MLGVSMTRQKLNLPVTAILLAVTAAALLIRLAAIAEPLGIDQSLWASAARGMARGQRLYRDIWEQRPPGIYWTYLAGFRLFGWNASTVAWLDILASCATTTVLFVLARRLADERTAAATAAIYAVFTHPSWQFRYDGFLERSVCETFTPLCVALAAWAALRFRDRESPAWALACGFFAGAAIVYKPNAGLYFPALLAWLAFYRRERNGWRTFATRLAPSLVGGAIVPALAIVWLWRLDLLHDARVAVVDFNRYYVSQGFSPGGYAVEFSKAVWLRIKTDPLWCAGAAGAVAALWDLARTRRLSPATGLAVLWGAAGALVIVVNGARLFNSYFMQVFAPLALLGACVLTERARASRSRRALAAAIGVAMAVLFVTRHYPTRVLEYFRPDLAVLRGRLDEQTYLDRFGGYGNDRGYSARANAELASYVRAHTAPEDRIFLFGINGAGVYFLSDRLPAHRFLRVNFFVDTDFPDPAFRLDAVIADLQAARPRYLIFERLHSGSEMGKAVDRLQDTPPVMRLLSGYRREAEIEDFTLYARVE